MVRLSVFRSLKGGTLARAKLISAGVLTALTLSAAMASSASAFSWWIGSPSHPEMLEEGKKLLLGTESNVKTPFTLKWLHGYEVRCAGAKYAGLYIEGPVLLGARKITFEECTAKKPKGAVVAGGTIETNRLEGEIKPAGAKVEFDLKPVGVLFASFDLERVLTPTVRHKHHRVGVRTRRCEIEVSVQGQASGDLGDATTISSEKTFEFNSKGLETSQVKSCRRVPTGTAAAREDAPQRASDARHAATTEEEEEEAQEAQEKKEEEEEIARELKEEEEEEGAEEREEQEEAAAIEQEETEAAELEEKREAKLAEAEACREGAGSPSECKTIEKEAKAIEEIEAEHKAEKIKELEELSAEQAGRAEEEAVKAIEGNKGKDSYNGGFGWGV